MTWPGLSCTCAPLRIYMYMHASPYLRITSALMCPTGSMDHMGPMDRIEHMGSTNAMFPMDHALIMKTI